MTFQSKLLTRRMPWHANMTEMNHLGKALLSRPEVFEGKMTELFTAKRYSDNPLTAMLNKSEKSLNSREWEWQVRAATRRPLVVIENVEPATSLLLGIGKTDFNVKLDEQWYLPGDVIAPNGVMKYQSRIQGQAIKHGNGFIYRCRAMNDDFAFGIPQKYFTPGVAWVKLFSQYEEGAEQSGSTQYALPLSLKSRMSRYRKQYKVTGDVANEVLAVKIPDSKGMMHDRWIKYAEVEYWEQWYRELERGLWYSRSTNSVLGNNGRPILSGPGVQELLEDSNVHKYSILSAKLIEEFLMDIFYSRVKPGAGRRIKGFTGEYGMIQFHRAIQSWAAKTGFIQVVDQVLIDKVSSEYNSNAIAAGYQYVKYRMANGAELELVHNPLYDDRELNMEIDPVTGYPMESQRITFLDFSGRGVEGNIQMMTKNNSFKLGYVAGLQTPFGPTNNSIMSHEGDYYAMHVQKECGIHIEDISLCGELILERN